MRVAHFCPLPGAFPDRLAKTSRWPAAPSWYRMQIPVRPNGTTGYVCAKTVDLVLVKTRIEVDVSERRVELFRHGSLVMRLPAAIGSPETPTPTGRGTP
jgi:L,D-transpeptidase catalytic domain